MSEQTKLLTLSQAANYLGCNPETVRRHAQAGKIPAAKLGRKWVFIEQDLAQYLRNQYSTPESVVQVVDNNEESLCQSTNETLSGGLNSLHQMEREYSALLGLKTESKRKNSKQS
ncbi:helix-turn-helix domain-containing protein [Thiomicrorhabdus xiamenensis]|uniref:Helix-turn-helix domain-containing protein n=1 Tax=Thiomicrorhabdus xiamenensis TaxID=2739063 RepID=A0A7D4NK48_9GAMM|nr:helix-turn-helix domain-containing protein [Thiomicrorhabdus xiamenensis]QKI88909.1 helix-turn-helix domain-containing protein [Thiomicrorhabdus xiamenensis]